MIRGAALLALAACAHAPAAPHGQDANARARAVADATLQLVFVRYPGLSTNLRVPGETYESLSPSSIAEFHAYEQHEDALLAEAKSIDVAALTDPNAKLGLEIARDQLERSRGARICRNELWAISPSAPGWQNEIGNLAQMQPVGTAELRAHALVRFGKLPQYIDDQIAALREGEKLGYTAAKPTVAAVIAQVTALEQMPVDQSPYFSPAARDNDPAFRDQFTALVRDQINPAIHRYRTFLADEYLAHARESAGVSANPDGAACYRAALRFYTSLDLDPREVHELGVRRLAELEAEMKEIAQRSFGTTDLSAVMQQIKTDPRYTYTGKDDITKQTEAALARARAALPAAFNVLPKADFVLEPIPAYQEKAASPYYLQAALDGSRPAAYRVRYYEPTHQSRANGEAIAFHEVLPGHHLQNAIAEEHTDLPRIARFLIISGYNEGWGLYSERLADELHLYSDDTERLGMLGLQAVRAVRLIVDTGIHTQGWDRQKAIDLMVQHTTFNADQSAAEIDRYISWPGQATAYVVGEREITKLRDEATKALGPRFDLRAFHDRVLEHGAIPLPLLRRYVEAWIGGH